jgi:DNA-binding XRE family transcriptional regulator
MRSTKSDMSSFAIWRALLDITQANAASILGVTTRTIERYESGEIIPRRSVRRVMFMHALDLAALYTDRPEEWPIDPRNIPAWTVALDYGDNDGHEDDLPDATIPTSRRGNSENPAKSRSWIRRFLG